VVTRSARHRAGPRNGRPYVHLDPARTLIDAVTALDRALTCPPGDPVLLDGSTALTAAVRGLLMRSNALLAVTDPDATPEQVEQSFAQDLALARAVLARTPPDVAPVRSETTMEAAR